MSAITFDTLKFVERLEKAGVLHEHAAAFADEKIFEKHNTDFLPISNYRMS